jgi:hypothetical protein
MTFKLYYIICLGTLLNHIIQRLFTECNDERQISYLRIFTNFPTTDKRTDVWSRPSYIYTKIFSPKKNGFSPIENTFQKFVDFCLPLFYATFQCGP